MIQNIAIEKPHEHPDNPRRDIGDVTELSDEEKAYKDGTHELFVKDVE